MKDEKVSVKDVMSLHRVTNLALNDWSTSWSSSSPFLVSDIYILKAIKSLVAYIIKKKELELILLSKYVKYLKYWNYLPKNSKDQTWHLIKIGQKLHKVPIYI